MHNLITCSVNSLNVLALAFYRAKLQCFPHLCPISLSNCFQVGSILGPWAYALKVFPDKPVNFSVQSMKKKLVAAVKSGVSIERHLC